MDSNLLSSPNSSSTSQWRYHAFLSFRGEDTRNKFTDHLYTALVRSKIVTFRDQESLKKGTVISPELSKAIKESIFAIVILSENYAFSSWCLDELAKIIEYKNELKMTVLPVFHYVDPSDVKKLRKTFKKAIDEHEKRFEEKKVKRWRDALIQVGGISGFHLQENSPETQEIERIVGEISAHVDVGNVAGCHLKSISPEAQHIQLIAGQISYTVRYEEFSELTDEDLDNFEKLFLVDATETGMDTDWRRSSRTATATDRRSRCRLSEWEEYPDVGAELEIRNQYMPNRTDTYTASLVDATETGMDTDWRRSSRTATATDRRSRCRLSEWEEYPDAGAELEIRNQYMPNRTDTSQAAFDKANMEELHMAALAYYRNASNELSERATEFFNSMDTNGDGGVSFNEFFQFFVQNGYNRLDPNFFRSLDLNGNGCLDFFEVVTFYYILKTRRVCCNYCGNYQMGLYFTCVVCFDNARSTGNTYDLCSMCYKAGRHQHHHHNHFLDSYVLLRAKAGLPLLAGAPNVRCGCCGNYLMGLYFTCVACFDNAGSTGYTYDLCSTCYGARRHRRQHPHHNYFLDSYVLLLFKAGLPLLAGAPNLQQGRVQHAPNISQQALVQHAPNISQQALVPRSAPNTPQQKRWKALQALETALIVGNMAAHGCSIM